MTTIVGAVDASTVQIEGVVSITSTRFDASAGATIDHGDLTGRNLPNQHPASAIDVDGTPLDTVLDNVPLLDAANMFTAKQSIDVVVPVTPLADIATTKPTILAHLHGGGGAVVDHFAITLDIGGGVISKTTGTLAAVLGLDGEPTDEWVATAVGPTGPAVLGATSSDPGELPFIGDLLTSTPKPLVVGTGTDPSHAVTKAQLDASSGAVDSVNGETGVVVLDAADVGAAATSHTHAASDVTSGTLDIARIPTGTTGSTVPFGNDARFTDARTPTDGSVTTAKLDATLTAALARIPTTVVLAADRASDTSATIANTTDLSFPVTSGTTYIIRGMLDVTGASAGDLRVSLTCPSGTVRLAVWGKNYATSATGAEIPYIATIVASGGIATDMATVTGQSSLVLFEGYFTASASGTFQMQHGQRSANATPTTVKAGSYLTYHT